MALQTHNQSVVKSIIECPLPQTQLRCKVEVKKKHITFSLIYKHFPVGSSIEERGLYIDHARVFPV